MLKKLFVLTASLLFGFGLQAQTLGTSNTVIKGANGAKTVILGKATGAYPEHLSGDARYLCGMYGGGAGYVYDFTDDTCIIFMEATLTGYVSANHYSGQNDPGEPIAAAFTYYNGIHYLDKVLPHETNSYGEVFINATQGNGEKIVAMVYEEYTKADGSIAHMNYPAIYDGKTGKFLFRLPYAWEPPLSDEARLMFGARGDCISGDGAIVGGHSTNPDAKSNWALAFWDISDPNDIRAFGLEGSQFGFGSFYGTNSDGSLIAGGSQTNGFGVIVHYDRANKAISKIDTIAPLISWDFLTFTGIDDNGLAIGYCGMELDPGTREAVVYSELTGLVKMTDFLYEYYDIDVRRVDLYTPMLISYNGKRIIGWDNSGLYPVPYSHELSETRILPRARQITARAARGESKAVISWVAPLVSDHTPTGYNIYLDDMETALNATPLSINTLTYTDETVEPGKHTYYVEVIYADGLSMKQSSNVVQVVDAGMAFPVQALSHRVEYNRYADIYWGVPSSEVSALSKNDLVSFNTTPKGRFEHAVEDLPSASAAPLALPKASKSYVSTTLDYIANVDMLTYSGKAAVQVGDEYYTSSWLDGGIRVINSANQMVKLITSSQMGLVQSMLYFEDDNVLYCGTSHGLKSYNLDELVHYTEDVDTVRAAKSYSVPAANFLAYVPDMKDGRPGLVAGTPHACHTYLWDDELEDYDLYESNILDFGSLYAQGAAYYDGKLYISSASGPYYNEVYVYDFATKTQLGAPIQVVEDPALYNLLTMDGNEYLTANMSTICQAGGLSVFELEDGTTALGLVFQCNYMTARLMLLELESAESVKGYDLYRSVDGGEYAKVNDEPLTRRRYAETLNTAGQYTYYVVVRSENGAKDSDPSLVDTIRIADQGLCPKPDLKLRESNRWPVLEWMSGESPKSIVGFDLYRDRQLLARMWETDICFDYVDDQVTEPGSYTYRLEVLYEDGCAADTTETIEITGKGVAMPPFGLALDQKPNGDDKYDVTASWETPMFEEPLALRFCNGVLIENIGFENFYECWGVIGWDKSNNLELYKDLYLVGMEYGIGAIPQTLQAIVILNNKIVYTQDIARPLTGGFQTVMFDKSFPMDQPNEVAVGFHTKYDANSNVLIVDPTIVKTGSNIVSLDGRVWSTLKAGGVDGSWLISALVVNKRDLEAAKNNDGSIDGVKLAGSVMRMAAEEQPLSVKANTLPGKVDFKPATKEGLQLVGYNVYRQAEGGDEIQLNDEPLTSYEFVDEMVAENEYTYYVGAVYADGQVNKASKFIIVGGQANEDGAELLNLNLYPNPANEWVNVEGEYQTLQIFDFSGRLVRSQAAEKQIYVGDLNPGTYMLHFTGNDARKAVYKVVVR